mmetsp:Transcript_42510/g.81318  ORF Transcript_42510/g.81318 Transcript_42510/m.81318 type:complete len:344 (-) Transcript_42510:364-1395(-)
MPRFPVLLPAHAICRKTVACWPADRLSSRRSATSALDTTAKSSRCSPMKSKSASIAPPLTSCELQDSCTAMCEIAPIAYSRMFSFCMNSRADCSKTWTASVFANTSRLASELARFEMAPNASFATLRSSWVRHLESTLRTCWMTPLSPSWTRKSGSDAKLPNTPHASLSKDVLSSKAFIAWIVASINPRFTISSRYCALRLSPRTMPRAASWSGEWSKLACNTAASDVIQPEASNDFCTSPQSAEQVQIAEATLARVLVSTELSKAAMRASTPPWCKTVKQQSSLTAKLLRNLQTATTSVGRPMQRLRRSTRMVMPPLSFRARRCRVRFARIASAVIASSRTL